MPKKNTSRFPEHGWGVCPKKDAPIDNSLPTFSWNMLLNHLNREGINADNNAMFGLKFCGELYPNRYSVVSQVFEYQDVVHATFAYMEEENIQVGRGVIPGINNNKALTPRLAFLLYDLEEEPIYLTGYVFRKI